MSAFDAYDLPPGCSSPSGRLWRGWFTREWTAFLGNTGHISWRSAGLPGLAEHSVSAKHSEDGAWRSSLLIPCVSLCRLTPPNNASPHLPWLGAGHASHAWRCKHKVICLLLSWMLKNTASCHYAYAGKYCPDLSPQEKGVEGGWIPVPTPLLSSVLDSAARERVWLHIAKPKAADGAFLLLCKGNCLCGSRNHLLAREVDLPAVSCWAQGYVSMAGPPVKYGTVSQQAWARQAQRCADSGSLTGLRDNQDWTGWKNLISTPPLHPSLGIGKGLYIITWV